MCIDYDLENIYKKVKWKKWNTSWTFFPHFSWNFRQQSPPVFYKKGNLKNFEKFKGKYLCRGPLLIKLNGYILNITKKRLRHRCFLVDLQKNFQCSFSIEHLRVTELCVFTGSTLARDSVSSMSIKASFFYSKELETRKQRGFFSLTC